MEKSDEKPSMNKFHLKTYFINGRTSHFLLLCIVQKSFAWNINWLCVMQCIKHLTNDPVVDGSSLTGSPSFFWK